MKMNSYKVLVGYEVYTTVSLTAASDKAACKQAEECISQDGETVTSSKITSKEIIPEPLSKKDSIALVSLAINPDMSHADREKIIVSLHNDAKEIAFYLTGIMGDKVPSERTVKFVKGLQEWVAGLQPPRL